MYARSTTMRISPHSVDGFVARVRDDVLPMVTEIPGCVGLSCLADADSGRCITTSAWENHDAMRASASKVSGSRERVAESFAAAPEVQEWEIAVLHRAHKTAESACARVTWCRTDTQNVERVIGAYRDSLMPWWEETPGFSSNSLLVDWDDGQFASAVVFESHDAMAHTRDQFITLREEFAQRMNLEILEVAEFAVVVAELRVPETV
jgi:quinol monooxygenase YgiN